jgi:hypothetical protein
MSFVTKIASMKSLIELLGHNSFYDKLECNVRSSLTADLTTNRLVRSVPAADINPIFMLITLPVRAFRREYY